MAERKNPFLIDLNDLAGEWQQQPGLAREAGRRLADAKHAQAQAEAALAVVKARLYLAIRNDPTKFDLRAKPTGDEVDAAVMLEKTYADAVTRVNLSAYETEIAKADTVAFVDRRKALENVVELMTLDYHNEREPRAVSDEARRVIDTRRRRNAIEPLDDES